MIPISKSKDKIKQKIKILFLYFSIFNIQRTCFINWKSIIDALKKLSNNIIIFLILKICKSSVVLFKKAVELTAKSIVKKSLKTLYKISKIVKNTILFKNIIILSFFFIES